MADFSFTTADGIDLGEFAVGAEELTLAAPKFDGVAKNVSGINVTTGSPSPDWASISMS